MTDSTFQKHEKHDDTNLEKFLRDAYGHNFTLNEVEYKLKCTALDLLGYCLSRNEIRLDPQCLQPLY